jgi:hypothetical protein
MFARHTSPPGAASVPAWDRQPGLGFPVRRVAFHLAWLLGLLIRTSGRPRLVLFLLYTAVVFTGGVIAGWPPDLRLAQPFQVQAGEAVIEPVGVTAARWTRQYLGPDQPVLAPESDSLLMLAYGEQRSPPRRGGSLHDFYFSPDFGSGEMADLESIRPRYVVFDRRLIAGITCVVLFSALPCR